MKIIKVKEMFECPFQYTEVYQLSELTSGADTMCSITKEDCYLKSCSLKKEKGFKVMWDRKEN